MMKGEAQQLQLPAMIRRRHFEKEGQGTMKVEVHVIASAWLWETAPYRNFEQECGYEIQGRRAH
jgi:uncharacterized membrane-anchored protein